MKKFLFYSAIYILPILVAIFFCEFFLRKIPNDYSFKKQYLDNNSDSIVTLFLGNSQAFYGIDPYFYNDRSFNASHISQTLDFDYKILKKYELNFTNLKNIVIPISYVSLVSKLEKSTECWRVKNYSIYYEMCTTKNISDYSEFFSNKLKYVIYKLYDYYIQDKSFITCSELGFGINYSSKNIQDLEKTGKTAAKRHTKNDSTLFAENLKTILDIIKYSENKNIPVYFYTPPTYKSYVKNLDAEQLNLTFNTMINIDKQYANCYYFNFLSDTAFTELDFYDADHLNEIGAKKLTMKINELINKTNYQIDDFNKQESLIN